MGFAFDGGVESDGGAEFAFSGFRVVCGEEFLGLGEMGVDFGGVWRRRGGLRGRGLDDDGVGIGLGWGFDDDRGWGAWGIGGFGIGAGRWGFRGDFEEEAAGFGIAGVDGESGDEALGGILAFIPFEVGSGEGGEALAFAVCVELVDGPQSAGSEDEGADDDFADGDVFHEAAIPGMSESPGVILQGTSGEIGSGGVPEEGLGRG